MQILKFLTYYLSSYDISIKNYVNNFLTFINEVISEASMSFSYI